MNKIALESMKSAVVHAYALVEFTNKLYTFDSIFLNISLSSAPRAVTLSSLQSYRKQIQKKQTEQKKCQSI